MRFRLLNLFFSRSCFNLYFLLLLSITSAKQSRFKFDEYQQIQNSIQTGWNTWNTSSVIQHVLLPQGFAINLAFKQHYFLEEKYLREVLIGRRSDNAEYVRPGAHTLNGSYTSLGLKWEEVDTKISSAHIDDDLVILISPNSIPKNRVKVIM